MLSRFFRKLVNRRKEADRYPLILRAQTTDASGQMLEVQSEDISEKGIRLKFDTLTIADLLGQLEEISVEVFFEEEVTPVKVQAKLVWALTANDGRCVSGWEFLDLRRRSLRRFRMFIDRTNGIADKV